MTRRGLRLSRRGALLGALGALALGAPAVGQADRAAPPLLVVDRAKLLENTAAVIELSRTEAHLRAAVEARLERVKTELEAEERALTDARAAMDPDEFARRGAAFDQRVRRERRGAQERGAQLLKFIDDARGALSARLPAVLEELREARGAVAILDAAAAAAYDADVDVTAEAVALFDRTLGDLRFDPPDMLLDP